MTSSQVPSASGPDSRVGGVHIQKGARGISMRNVNFQDIRSGDSYTVNNDSSAAANPAANAPGQVRAALNHPDMIGGVHLFEGASNINMSHMEFTRIVSGDLYTINNNSSRTQSSSGTYNPTYMGTNTVSSNQSHSSRVGGGGNRYTINNHQGGTQTLGPYSTRTASNTRYINQSSADNNLWNLGMWQSQFVPNLLNESFVPGPSISSWPPSLVNSPPQAYYNADRPGVYDDSPQYDPRIPHTPYSEYAQYDHRYFPPSQPPVLLPQPHAPYPLAGNPVGGGNPYGISNHGGAQDSYSTHNMSKCNTGSDNQDWDTDNTEHIQPDSHTCSQSMSQSGEESLESQCQNDASWDTETLVSGGLEWDDRWRKREEGGNYYYGSKIGMEEEERWASERERMGMCSPIPSEKGTLGGGVESMGAFMKPQQVPFPSFSQFSVC